MYIHSFRLIAPRRLLEAQLFNQQYQNYEDIPNVPDRLRWCRHHMGLMQKEVADLIAFFICAYGFIIGNLFCLFLFGTKMHEQFIFDTSCRIGGKSSFFRIYRGNGFDQTNGSDRNQFFLFIFGTLIFFYYMGYQSHISKDQNFSGSHISLPAFFHIVIFFFYRKWFWKCFQKKHLKGELLQFM